VADAGTHGRARPRLKRYAQKRDFAKTAEPSHVAKAKRGKKPIFVIQKHAARRLHWDFRLEYGDTLRSWAVPKGPSLDPADKRLAVEVEDHPIAYAKFEGDIPKGEYGGGHVDIWDKGTWEPTFDPKRGFAKGHLEFLLHGKKLSGKWHLVRTRMQGKAQQWLLMKSDDFAARAGADADIIDAGESDDPKRLLHKSLAAVGKKAKATPPPPAPKVRRVKSLASRGQTLPASVKPQLATLVDEVPGDDGWVYELKYDGIRLLCRVDGDDVRCISRNGLDWTKKVPPIVAALADTGLEGAWLDGELIVTDPNGRSDFSLLQHTLEQKKFAELRFTIFDALYLNGKDLRGRQLSERKTLLDAALAKLPPNGPLRLADQIHSDSAALITRVCNQHLEGLVAKRIDSLYTGTRSPDWLKIKCHREQEFVVGGAAFLPGRGTGTFSSLLVGVKSGKGVKYAGRVGGGFDTSVRAEWRARVKQLEQKNSPFDRLPEKRSGEIWHWMKPKLVIQVAFQDFTQDGILRQPRYLGMREDRDPKTVIREEPAHTSEVAAKSKARPKAKRAKQSVASSDNAASQRTAKTGAIEIGGQRLSHPDRVLYPHDGITKQQLAEYFEAVGELAMPHYQDRPLSILRNTHGAQPFFQKHFLDKSGEGLRIVKIPNADKDPDFVVCDSPAGLLHLAQVGAVELHSWGAVMPKPTQADRLTFDLDPGASLGYPPIRDAALAIRKLMKDLALESWVKTTGGKGLHVVVPLTAPLPGWELAKEFTHAVSKFLERIAPTLFTSKTGERNRKNKIFVDYLRNGFGATAVAAYSPRWRPGVGVSTPVAWDEIDEDVRGTHFDIHNVPARVAKLRGDPWKAYWRCKQMLSKKTLGNLPEG
jgi:bifunctional non-homologous end joining protein LigD